MTNKPKNILLKIGSTLFIVSFIINGVLVYFGIGGLVRELTRLCSLIGVALIIVCLVNHFKKKI